MREIAFIEYQWKKIRIAVLILGLVLLYALLHMDISIELRAFDVLDAWQEWSLLDVFDFIGENSLLYLGRVSGGVASYSHIAWVTAVFMAFALFEEYGDDGKLSLFRSLPYTKRQMWRCSWLMGGGIISVGYLVLAVASIFLYLFTYTVAHDAYLYSPAYEVLCSIDTLGNALLYILEECVIALGVFSVAVFARMAMGHVLAALLFLAGVFTAPSILLEELGRRLTLRGNGLGHGIMVLGERMMYLADRLLVKTAHLERSLDYYTPYHSYDEYSGHVTLEFCTYEWGTMVLWVGIGAVAMVFACRLTRKETAFSRIGRTPLLENLFILLAGLYPALLVMTGMSGGIRKSLPVMIVVFLMIEGIMVYFFKGNRGGKYEKWNTWRGGESENHER